MLILAALLLGQDGVETAGASGAATPACTVRQLAISVDSKEGEFSGMQKSGTELLIRNNGADCTFPALPRIEFLDAHGRALPIARLALVGMRPGPVMVPVRVGGGQRAATDLSWIIGPVYAHNKQLRVAYLRITVGGGNLRTRLVGMVNAQLGKQGTFGQPPLRVIDGMAAG